MASVTVSRPAVHPARRALNTIYLASSPVEVGPQAPGRGDLSVGLLAQGTAKKVIAQTGRCTLGAAPATATATALGKVSPQTGRVTVGFGGRATPEFSVLTGSFTHVTVTRDYDLADGAAPIGTVYFTPSGWLLNNGVTLVAAPVAAALDSAGVISISLAANTDPGTTPVGSYYTVREVIVGQPNRTYKVSVPANAGLSVDLATLPVIP